MALLGLVLCLVAVACGVSAPSRSGTGTSSGGTAAMATGAISLFYGEDGPPAPGKLPRSCPPPLNGMLPGFPIDAAHFATWEQGLNGRRCYGKDGPYSVCGDGYGDQYLGYPPEQSGQCQGARVSGLRYGLDTQQRTANATGVIGGECLEAIDRTTVTLVDCRLPHLGRIVWGRSRITKSSSVKDNAKACDINRRSWEGFSETQLLVSGDETACIALRPGRNG